MSIRTGIVLPILLLCAPIAAHAQENTPTFPDTLVRIKNEPVSNIPQAGEKMKPEEEASTSGYFLGLISMFVGATVGSNVGQQNCPAKSVDKDCMSRHAFTGALVAGSAMIPIGVHLATTHKRSLPATLGISALAGSALYFGARSLPGQPIGLAAFVALPIQVITSVRMERGKHTTTN